MMMMMMVEVEDLVIRCGGRKTTAVCRGGQLGVTAIVSAGPPLGGRVAKTSKELSP